MSTLCQRCHENPAKHGERYCKECRKQVLSELKENGYLTHTPLGHAGMMRTTEQKENVRETKFGKDQG